MLLCAPKLLFLRPENLLKEPLFVRSGGRMKSRTHALLPAAGGGLFLCKLNKSLPQSLAAREPRFPVQERDNNGRQ